MNDKQQLAAMGAQYRLTEEQANGLAERMPQTGALQVIDDEPLCMAKRIEELEAQVLVMAELLREAQRYVRYRLEYTECDARIVMGLVCDIDAALAGNLPSHADQPLAMVPEGWQLVPVVPEGWKLEALDNDCIVVRKDGVGFYVASFNAENIASTILHALASDMLAVAPKPEPKP